MSDEIKELKKQLLSDRKNGYAVVLHENAPDGGCEDEGDDADGEDGGQEMYELERLGVFFIKVYAGYSAVEHLAEELAEVGTALVPYPCVGKQAAAAAGFEDAYAEIDVFAETHLREASEALIDVAAYAHVV